MSDERKDDESGEGDSNRSGDEVLRDLGISMQTMVYCPLADGMLHVTDRSTAVGLCCHLEPQIELYLTADELYAVRHVVNFNYQLLWVCCFDAKSERFRSIFSAETAHSSAL